jgi:rod shape-determining protein MreC
VHDSRRTRVVLGVLLAAALALITFDARGGASPAGRLRTAGAGLFGPLETVAAMVAAPFVRVYDGITSGPAAQDRITALEQQVTRLRLELSQARLSRADAAQLRQLLQLAGRGRYRVVAARVIAAGAGYDDTVTIDAGSADGIKPSETVVNGAGLVGTVATVGAHTSTVMLMTDPAATAGVRLAGTNEIGAVTGTGRSRPGLLRLQVFDASAVLRPGQQIVTFGSVGGRPYVPGVPVGVITQVTGSANSLTKLALVRPFASDTSLGVVGVVIVPPRVNPRDSVLPPRPAPAPVPSLACRGGTAGAASSPQATPSPQTTGGTPAGGAGPAGHGTATGAHTQVCPPPACTGHSAGPRPTTPATAGH